MATQKPLHTNVIATKQYLSLVLGDMELALVGRKRLVKTVPLLFVSSEAHQQWAHELSAQMKSDLESVLPGVDVCVRQMTLKAGCVESVNALTDACAEYDLGSRGEGHFPYIITPGWHESIAVREIRSAQGFLTKQLYCMSADPYLLGLSVSWTDFAGAFALPVDARTHIRGITSFRPVLRRLCLIMDAEVTSERMNECKHFMRKEFEEVCRDQGIELLVHQWTQDDMRAAELEVILEQSTAVVMLNEPAAAKHRSAVIEMCERYKVVVSASELDSVRAGAALGGGVSGVDFSPPLCRIIVNDIVTGRFEGFYQVTPCQGLHVNRDALERQGVVLSPQTAELLSMRLTSTSSSPTYLPREQE